MAADAHRVERHRLPHADAAWLHMDRPTNLMVINSVMLFDERVDETRLREVIRTRLVERYPRFRERIVESRAPLGGPSFESDPHFDLTRHMHRRGLPGPARPAGTRRASRDGRRAGTDRREAGARRAREAQADQAALRELVGDLIATPLDRAKPLWDMYLIDLPHGGQALVVRMHHCIADGIALARVMLSLTDGAPSGDGFAQPAPAPDQVTSRGTLGRALGAVFAPVGATTKLARSALGAGGRVAGGLAHEGIELVSHPIGRERELIDQASADAQALAKLLFSPADAQTGLRGELGVTRSVAWTGQLDLAGVKRAAHAQNATVNDILLASVTGALRRHMRERGEQPREIRTFVPFNLRPLEEPVPRELGNRFGLVFLSLPVNVAGRRARLAELARRMTAIKHSPEGPISYAILQAVGRTPNSVESRVVDIFTAKASAVMTNVPGPSEIVYLAGSPVRAVLVWAPTSGSVGLSVSIFSYRGEVTIGLLADRGLVADPQRIMRHTEQEFAALARLKPAARRGAAEPWTERPPGWANA